jgi:hypothetical protein
MTTGAGKKRGARGGGAALDDEPDIIVIAEETGEPIDLGTPEVVETDPETEEPAPTATEEDPFEPLRRGKSEAETALAAARARNAELEAIVAGNQADTQATELAIVKHAAVQARNEAKAAAVAFAKAMKDEDFEAAGAAQVLINEKTADAREFEAAAGEIERAAREPKTQPKRQQPAPQDPIEQVAASLTPASGDWLRKNKAVAFKSQASWAKTIAAHHEAVEAGHQQDSPEYFQVLEKSLGIGQTEPRATTPAPARAPARRAPPMAAAPVSKGGAPTANTVTLSADERAAAKRMGMTPAKYGAYKKLATERANDPDYNGPKYSQHKMGR